MSTSSKEEIFRVALFAAIEHGYVDLIDGDDGEPQYRLTPRGRGMLRYVAEKPEDD